ncbi:GTPase-activating protein and VPS9 domain-containing protein 1-like [Ctenocephalides felis]|uniref:GTPase-activating protein and VPS9 domain-containing protein 1-like n=1 Tax=Ctenocephalides felis TaxID=7515 RepID=UPI000E6E349B|nr:GTPase-activating protein and VPS9 domain-containing protein 1-like [Ctenocephalides felis]
METNDSRPVVNNQDTTEDILAKYRRKISSSSEAATSGASDSTGSGSGSSCSKKNNLRHNDNNNMDSILDKQRMRNSISTMEPSSCNYEDAKHKLRLVLSNVDLQSVDFNTSCALSENTLTTFLRILLSESHSTNLDDNSLSVQLYETMRSIEQLSRSTGLNGILDLCRDLQFEYQSRSLYVQYLVNTRRVLLQTLAYLERILNRLNSERTACDEHLLRVGVRAFLESREREMTTFCEDFCALRLSDEKIDLLETFLRAMHSSMLKDVNWQAASEEQLAAATLCIERIVMSRVYLNALYPNGEGDIARDNVLHAHMERLSRVVTVSHRDLRIPMRHQREAPWPRSQALLRQMSAYRAARDKARCVARCVTSVMHVLAMTSPRATPSADDLVPVLVFILIKANPPALLSTVEYVNSFYGNCLQGAEHYWWIQFCSAIEFIKTMDDN